MVRINPVLRDIGRHGQFAISRLGSIITEGDLVKRVRMDRIQYRRLEEEGPAVPFAADNPVGLSRVHMGHAQLVLDFRVVGRQPGRHTQRITRVQSAMFHLQIGFTQPREAWRPIRIQFHRTLERTGRLTILSQLVLCHALPVVSRRRSPVFAHRLLKMSKGFMVSALLIQDPARVNFAPVNRFVQGT